MGKGFKRILMGEKMPDKNDPKYRERYEKEVKAGARFAHWCGIDRAAVHVQRFADKHRNLFLILVFGFVIGCFCLNIYRLSGIYGRQAEQMSVVELQDSLLRERRTGMTGHNTQSSNHKPYKQ